MWRAESSAVAVSRSSAASCSVSATVRTAWPSFRPSFQIGYHNPPAMSETSVPRS